MSARMPVLTAQPGVSCQLVTRRNAHSHHHKSPSITEPPDVRTPRVAPVPTIASIFMWNYDRQIRSS